VNTAAAPRVREIVAPESDSEATPIVVVDLGDTVFPIKTPIAFQAGSLDAKAKVILERFRKGC
jgi:hypothetical protein